MRAEHALPARLDFLLAAQRLVVEVEVLLHERVAQVRRGAVDGVEAQVALPLVGRHVGQHLADFLVEGRHRQREHLRRGDALRLEELASTGSSASACRRRPARPGCSTATTSREQFLARLRHLGQARFERDHVLGLLRGIGGGDAGQLEHLGDVRLVGVAACPSCRRRSSSSCPAGRGRPASA